MTPRICKSIGCKNAVAPNKHDPLAIQDFCGHCQSQDTEGDFLLTRYPDQYRAVGDTTEVDVFAINQMFQIQDSSGCLQHALRKVLLSGNQSNPHADIREARDTLTRWLQLNTHQETE